ncbi:spore coat protein (plasmid) [Priestia megaterium]|uniref:spore coat protein n=1 Tax=Priestia megaterium TaxID=1404 RepID=UPI003138DBA8
MDSVIQDLKQFAKIKQKNAQKTIIENSTNVKVRTSDTALAVNLLLLLQVLVAILVSLEIL